MGVPDRSPRESGRACEAYLALGANLGDRITSLRRACALLHADGVDIVGRSPVFETDAVADEPQPPYLNAALRVQTAHGPERLLQVALDVERQLGRQRPREGRWAARLIDIDVLIYEDLVGTFGPLILPHPRLLERAFVRVPLSHVARPGLYHPISREPLDRASADAGVRLWPERL